MTEQAAIVLDEEDLTNDWAWRTNCLADLRKRVARLATLKETKPSLLQIWEELVELMLELEVHWRGQSPEDQQRTAKDVREVLCECEALKQRMRSWALKQMAKHADGAKAALEFRDRMREFGKDFRRRHPKQGGLF